MAVFLCFRRANIKDVLIVVLNKPLSFAASLRRKSLETQDSQLSPDKETMDKIKTGPEFTQLQPRLCTVLPLPEFHFLVPSRLSAQFFRVANPLRLCKTVKRALFFFSSKSFLPIRILGSSTYCLKRTRRNNREARY